MSGAKYATVFESIANLEAGGDFHVLLDTALVEGLKPEVAKEFLDWVNKIHEQGLRPRHCPFCGVPV